MVAEPGAVGVPDDPVEPTPAAMRQALGHFASGVTVVTGMAASRVSQSPDASLIEHSRGDEDDNGDRNEGGNDERREIRPRHAEALRRRVEDSFKLADENVGDDEADRGSRGKARADDKQGLAPQEGGDLVALRSEQREHREAASPSSPNSRPAAAITAATAKVSSNVVSPRKSIAVRLELIRRCVSPTLVTRTPGASAKTFLAAAATGSGSPDDRISTISAAASPVFSAM